jgi:very-short-patch-repair endonuclease
MHTNNLDQQVVQMYNNGDSTHVIAKALNTYPNKIKRILEKNGITLRDKKQAQENSAKQGRYKHPTEGKTHSPEVRKKISEAVHGQWAGLSDKEKDARKKQAQLNWQKLSDAEKESLQQKAHQAIRRAADTGSKMEIFLVNYLMDKGYEVIHHSTHKVSAEQMEIDVLMPADKIAIEIDGPSHFEPIWGEKSLKRNQVADNKKNGILIAGGYHVVRIRDKSKKFTRKIERSLIQCIDEAIVQASQAVRPVLIIKEVE